ncbi:unnamed protein product [Mycena citricolor]|uniref:1-acyl-sn-glycerol-3-phosphate acyltransferase n=1 Tax=Mycena citricolor TaxID=2018698 RepID=A0AAD2K3F4_9AGAR|nr:unnamed protein product [Mycena citricolor]
MAALLALLKPVAYVSLPFVALQSWPLGRYYSRTVVYVSTMGFVATISAFVAAGMSAMGSRFDVNFVVARTFYYLAGSVLGITIEIEGEEYLRDEKDGGAMPAVLLANHQSMLDILPVGRAMPKQTSMTSKKSLQFSPLGPFMTMSGAIFIDRGNSAKAMHSLDDAVKTMRAKRISLWMFPEGTRHQSPEPSMLPFKKGGFHLAIQAGFPIIPIVFSNYWSLYHKGVFTSGTIRIKVLPPVPTAGLTKADIPELIERVRGQMIATLIEISPAAPASAEVPSKEQPTVAEEVVSAAVSESVRAMPDDATIDTVNAEKTPSATATEVSSVAGSSNDSVETDQEEEGMVLVGRPVPA